MTERIDYPPNTRQAIDEHMRLKDRIPYERPRCNLCGSYVGGEEVYYRLDITKVRGDSGAVEEMCLCSDCWHQIRWSLGVYI